MPKWCCYIASFALLLAMDSCKPHKDNRVDELDVDTIWAEPVLEDTLSLVEKEIEVAEESARFDRNFDDFMYVFMRSRNLQLQRVETPLLYVDANGDTLQLHDSSNWKDEFAFLDNEYYTVLYGQYDQMESVKDMNADSVQVERVDLDNQTIKVYSFVRHEGRWKLTMMEDVAFLETGISDFLHFYSGFSSDSIAQQESIARTLRISILDPEDDSVMDGTIDASQWSSFCSDVPGGVISNIRYGQLYDDPNQMILQKRGISHEMQEVFVFGKQNGCWKLTAYEN